jgi:hypothetical protein
VLNDGVSGLAEVAAPRARFRLTNIEFMMLRYLRNAGSLWVWGQPSIRYRQGQWRTFSAHQRTIGRYDKLDCIEACETLVKHGLAAPFRLHPQCPQCRDVQTCAFRLTEAGQAFLRRIDGTAEWAIAASPRPPALPPARRSLLQMIQDLLA